MFRLLLLLLIYFPPHDDVRVVTFSLKTSLAAAGESMLGTCPRTREYVLWYYGQYYRSETLVEDR